MNEWVVLIGFASGLLVGTGFIAFIVALRILPRLCQITKTHRAMRSYELALMLGIVAGSLATPTLRLALLNGPIVSMIGLLHGVFIGMLAAGLTEILNVLPFLARKMKLNAFVVVFLTMIALGKGLGALVQCLIRK